MIASLAAFLIATGLILLLGVVLREEAPRLQRPVAVAMVLAIVLMALRSDLWVALYAIGVGACLVVIAAYLVAAVAAEIQRWRNRR